MLSVFRIVLIPFFVGVYISSITYPAVFGWSVSTARLVSAGILIFSGATDVADGIIARRYNMVTQLGRILDPLADKLTQATVCVCLVIWSATTGLFAPVILLVIFVLKELLMLIGAAIIMKKGVDIVSAKWFGKLSTVVFYLVMISIIAFQLNETKLYILISISLAFMVFSFIMYVPIFFKLNPKKDD